MCRLPVFFIQCELSLEWITVTDYTKPHLTGKLLRKLAVKHIREGGQRDDLFDCRPGVLQRRGGGRAL